MTRIFSIIILTVLLIFTVAIVFLYVNRNEYIKEVIESVGRDVLQTKVLVGDVDLKPFEYSIAITNFSIENTQNHGSGEAIGFERVFVQLPDDLSFEPLHLKFVQVVNPRINFIQTQEGSNLEELIKNAKEYNTRDVESDSNSSMKIKLDELLIEEARVSATSYLLLGLPLDFTAPPIRIEKLGGEDGLPPDEIAEQLINKMLDATITIINDSFNKTIENVSETIKDLSKKALDQLDESVEEAEDVIKDVEKALDGLFN